MNHLIGVFHDDHDASFFKNYPTTPFREVFGVGLQALQFSWNCFMAVKECIIFFRKRLQSLIKAINIKGFHHLSNYPSKSTAKIVSGDKFPIVQLNFPIEFLNFHGHRFRYASNEDQRKRVHLLFP